MAFTAFWSTETCKRATEDHRQRLSTCIMRLIWRGLVGWLITAVSSSLFIYIDTTIGRNLTRSFSFFLNSLVVELGVGTQ